jgi:LPXTG-site transpeptidase (sortase) family protein
MTWLVRISARAIRAIQTVGTKQGAFTLVALLVFAGSVTLLSVADLLPESPVAPVATASAALAADAVREEPAEPIWIKAEKINLSTVVVNPTSTDIKALDKELLKGAVRYPTSAKLGEEGNVILFAHSSYLPAVLNPAYKAFNGIQKLVSGDVIEVSSATTVYTYRVRKVTKENAGSDAIPLQVSGRVLTLSTCDSFGAVTDRFVVTAYFVESHPLAL